MGLERQTHGRKKGGTLAFHLSGELRQQIRDGMFRAGDKLPSETQLTEAHGVSRTVVREAIASLRADGLVEARQGAGVFILTSSPIDPATPRLQDMDQNRISSVLEMLEIRVAVESEAAALAALRRSPQQEEHIIECHHAHMRQIQAGLPTAEAEYALHLAVAKAANSPKFVAFMTLIGEALVPRIILNKRSEAGETEYLAQLHEEHGRIVDAISAGDEHAAREAMRAHLNGSQARYRLLQRQNSDITTKSG